MCAYYRPMCTLPLRSNLTFCLFSTFARDWRILGFIDQLYTFRKAYVYCDYNPPYIVMFKTALSNHLCPCHIYFSLSV